MSNTSSQTPIAEPRRHRRRRSRDQSRQRRTPCTPYALGSFEIARDKWGDITIEDHDLNEHFYIIGRSGTGKSNLLTQLALADDQRGAGLCFIDPLGSTAEELVTQLRTTTSTSPFGASDANRTKDATQRGGKRSNAPAQQDASGRADHASASQNRQEGIIHGQGSDKDIIYFDAADIDYPIGINPLYNVPLDQRAKTVSDILQMFAGIWEDTGWGARMEAIFRASLHTLVENPHCMRPSLLTVFHLLLDEDFRAQIRETITNEQVADWWAYRFDRNDLNARTRREWVEPVLNKIDTLSLDPIIRNIIGQPRCILDFETIIRRRQKLIVNLNQNVIGQDNAAFIGMLIVSSIRQAASRVGNKDNPFTLTIDEAHTFPTTELTKIISQGRHHGLAARIAHQNLEQFSGKIAASLRNGCGSLAVFAVGNRDAETIVDDFASNFRDRTLAQINTLGRGECLLRLTCSGTPQAPSGHATLVHRTGPGDRSLTAVREATRQRFATRRLNAEFQISNAHRSLTKDAYLQWKERFRQERRDKAKEHKENWRRRIANRERLLDAGFGGAARDLDLLVGEMKSSNLEERGAASKGQNRPSQSPTGLPSKTLTPSSKADQSSDPIEASNPFNHPSTL